jgi:FtsP/CotA-like multicopper oxidase with cupredoxin domain
MWWFACGVPELSERRLPELPVAVDADPEPGVVELHLEAGVLEGTEIWGYRDELGGEIAVPGPLLRVHEGDRLRVHLHNALPESTTLHLHGVALPNDMDGSEITQMLVRPGEDHHHDFVVTHPGSFWYHPHFDVADQMARGLYGPGESLGDQDLHEVVDRTLVLVDVPPLEVDPEVWRVGRQGQQVLINGAPAGEDLVLHAEARERWRVLNAAHSRFFALSLEDQPLAVVGGDAGPVRTPWSADELVVAPGDRFEVIVEPEPGQRRILWSLPVDRGYGLPLEEPLPLLTVVGPPHGRALPPLPSVRSGMPPVGTPTGARHLTLSESTAPDGEPLFLIDGSPWPFSAPVQVRQGEIERWSVHNCTEGAQPFHLHGLFFDVLGEREHDSREDVAIVPAGGVLELAVPYEVPGQWMFHTHLLDQASHGMMSVLDVGEHDPTPGAPAGCP